MTDGPILLTIGQAAEALQIGKSLCYEMVAGGRLPAVRLSARCIRIPRAALEAWALQQAEQGADVRRAP